MEHSSPPPAPDVADLNAESTDPSEAVEYHPDTETYRVSFDSSTESVCKAIISTVAVISEKEPVELPPIYSAVDPDALEALLERNVTGPQNADIHISFTFTEWDITVHSYGVIAVRPHQDDQGRAAEKSEKR